MLLTKEALIAFMEDFNTLFTTYLLDNKDYTRTSQLSTLLVAGSSLGIFQPRPYWYQAVYSYKREKKQAEQDNLEDWAVERAQKAFRKALWEIMTPEAKHTLEGLMNDNALLKKWLKEILDILELLKEPANEVARWCYLLGIDTALGHLFDYGLAQHELGSEGIRTMKVLAESDQALFIEKLREKLRPEVKVLFEELITYEEDEDGHN